MKKTFYLFNPGQMERKDNTLKFTPYAVDEDGTEHAGQPRYLPVEDINEFYCFGAVGGVYAERNCRSGTWKHRHFSMIL